MNVIADAWIPVRTTQGQRIIRPDQIAEPDVLFPDWPRADLNIGCLELLIGLVYLADPVAEVEDWATRRADPDRLRAALTPLEKAFALGGDGPRFLQDLERFEAHNAPADISPPDMLFIDSAGVKTAKNNADVMVHRARYTRLDPALAAMALFTLQSQAPSGGAGNRTSMRGGGPMTTLVAPPEPGLWPLIWANVPLGHPQGSEALPWMRPTRRSDGNTVVHQPQDDNWAEAFFGMPRRLRLIFEGGQVTGVVQKPYGTNYEGWEHPLTPHYRAKAGSEILPIHPRAGAFGYRNWLGVTAAAPNTDMRRQAQVVAQWPERPSDPAGASVIVAGWAMDNMKPRDFTLSRQPLLADATHLGRLHGMIAAAEIAGTALRLQLKPVLGEGTAVEAQREAFFLQTQAPFESLLGALGHEDAPRRWLDTLRQTALALFDEAVLPGLEARQIAKVRELLELRNLLIAVFAGRTKLGKAIYDELGLPLPATKAKAVKEVVA